MCKDDTGSSAEQSLHKYLPRSDERTVHSTVGKLKNPNQMTLFVKCQKVYIFFRPVFETEIPVKEIEGHIRRIKCLCFPSEFFFFKNRKPVFIKIRVNDIHVFLLCFKCRGANLRSSSYKLFSIWTEQEASGSFSYPHSFPFLPRSARTMSEVSYISNSNSLRCFA